MRSETKPTKLLLMHLPGADLQFVHPFVDAGYMPNLSRLIDLGTLGTLRAQLPLQFPASTLTLATAQRADKHKIFDAVVADKDAKPGLRSTQSTDVAVSLLWELVAQHGGTSAAIGWPASYPAHPTPNTLIICDTFAEATGTGFEDWTFDPLSVSDPALHETLQELRLHPSEVTTEMILPFIKEALSIDFETDERLEHLCISLARTMTLHGAATWAAEHSNVDLLAVHFDFIERLTSLFVQYCAPRLGYVTKIDFARYQDVVKGAYQMFDMMLGVYLDLTGPDTQVMIASSHGYIAPHQRRAPKMGARSTIANLYQTQGMLLVTGPSIKPDSLNFGATSVDVAPTALALMGLPVSRDFDGHVLQGPFDLNNITFSEATLTVKDSAKPTYDLEQDIRRIHEWAKLGYIDSPTSDAGQNAETLQTRSLLALAETLMIRQDFGEALNALNKALALTPDNRDARFRVVQCALRLKQYDVCEAAILDLKESGMDQPLITYSEGHVALAQGHKDKGEALFKALEASISDDAKHLRLFEMVGSARLSIGLWGEAAASFKRVIDIDPTAVGSNTGLGRAYLGKSEHKLAEAALRTSLATLHTQPLTHARLAYALMGQGRLEEARSAFNMALQLAPDLPQALQGQQKLTKLITKASLKLVADRTTA